MASKDSEAVSRTQRRNKKRAVDYFGGKCIMCGYSKCLAALEFHHIDQNDKEFAPSHIIHTGKWEKVVSELEKCILLCANCHREIHYEKYSIEQLRSIKRELVKLTCKFCDGNFYTKESLQKYCSVKCHKNGRQRIDKPTKDQLEKLLWEMSTVKIGRMYDVSDTAVAKWAKNYGLKKPGRGYWRKIETGFVV